MKFLSFLAVCLLISVNISQAADFVSVQNGNWDVGATWGNPGNNIEGFGYPGALDNATVTFGKTVLLRNNSTVYHVVIDGGGTLSQSNNKVLTILGNYTINGIHAGGTGSRMIFSGSSRFLDGDGTVSLPGGIIVSSNRSISSTANVTISSDITLINLVTVTNHGEFTLVSPYSITAALPGPTWVNAANSTFNPGGSVNVLQNINLDASAIDNTVNYYQEADQNIKLPISNTYYHLKLTGVGTKSLTSDIAVNGNITIDGSTLSTSAYNINIKGNWENAGMFSPGTGTVTFSGSNEQSIANLSGETYYNLTVSKSAGMLTLKNNVTTSNILNMSGGLISVNLHSLILGTSTSSIGTLSYTAGYILDGKFRRWVNATGVSMLFPFGANFGYYTPIKIMFNNLSASGSVEAEFSAYPSGANGVPLVDGSETVYNTYGTGYYTVSPFNGLVSNNYNVELVGLAFFTLETSTRILTRANSASDWIANGTHADADLATGYAKRTNVTMMPAEFVMADVTNCSVAATSGFTGTLNACINSTENYTVTNNGNYYVWFVMGGTQSSGGNTNSISIDWGGNGGIGVIAVTEMNACGSSQPITMYVNISPIVPTSITGKEFAPENTSPGNEETYSVPSLPGYSFAWTISGGNIITGAGTNSVTVRWGTSGEGLIAVDITTSCGTVGLTQAIHIYVVINSVRSGSWNSASTWDCNCIPNGFNSTRVKNPHTVTFPNSNITIKNLIVDIGGIYNNTSNKILTVTDDIIINGEYRGNNQVILNGIGTYIDGIGTISTSGNLSITGGSKIIHSNSVLSRTNGAIVIGSNISISNGGIFSASGNIVGAALSSRWINESNSTLYIGGELLAAGTLIANAENNMVEYNGSVSQNIVATNYYTLQSSGSGARVLPASEVGIAFVFSPGFNTYTTTNNTLNFNGAIDQEIPEFSYNHLSVTNGGTKILTGSITCSNLTIGTSTTLDPDLYILNVKGNWTNNHLFVTGASSVYFNGTTAQQITGATDFYDLTIENTLGVSLNNVSNVTGLLTLTEGQFTTNENLIIDLNVGAVSGSGIGTTYGNITVYKDVNSPEYHYLSSPLSNATATQLNDDVSIVTTGHPNFYYYDETNTNVNNIYGWTGITNSSNVLTPMQGYALRFPGAMTVDFISTYNHNLVPATLTLSNTTSLDPDADGWHLVGNPYPSALDWDASSGWTKTNLDNAIYFWDAANDRYDAYVNGVGQIYATQYIPAMQAFWVRVNVSGGSGAFGMNNNVRVDRDNPSIFRKAALSNTLRMKVASGTFSDAAIIRFSEEATIDFDDDRDAHKMMNGGKTPSIFTKNKSAMYAINDLPLLFGETKVPLKVKAAFAGLYTFSAEQMGEFDNSVSIILEDKLLNTLQDLKLNPEYQFYITEGDTSERFFIVFRDASLTSVVNRGKSSSEILIQSYEESVLITFDDIPNGSASVTICNSVGQEIKSVSNAPIIDHGISIPVGTVSSGLYIVKVMKGSQMYSGKVFIGN